jgi:hypothetical protein
MHREPNWVLMCPVNNIEVLRCYCHCGGPINYEVAFKKNVKHMCLTNVNVYSFWLCEKSHIMLINGYQS